MTEDDLPWPDTEDGTGVEIPHDEARELWEIKKQYNALRELTLIPDEYVAIREDTAITMKNRLTLFEECAMDILAARNVEVWDHFTGKRLVFMADALEQCIDKLRKALEGK